MFLKSGFWSSGVRRLDVDLVADIDFAAVANYLDQNGYNYLGFVAYL